MPGPASLDDRRAAYQVVQAILEVLNGRRPLRQIEKLVEPPLLEALRTRTQALLPLRNTTQLRSLHVQRVDVNTLEVCATVQRNQAYCGIAGRFEPGRTGWTCICFIQPLFRALK